MTRSPNDVADLVRDVSTLNEAAEDQRLRAYRTESAARSAWTAELGSMSPRPAFNGEPGPAGPPRTGWGGVGGGGGPDDDNNICVHKSFFVKQKTAYDRSDVPWFGCAHEDRGDGVLVIVPPM